MSMMMRGNSPTLVHEPNSSWHSPVPYLFSGVASLLGLIAFAMLIRLAYSFWKLSEYIEENEEAKQDLEAQKATPQAHEEKIFVIMAGQENPTFLATPMWSNKSSSLRE
ncbi:hypothetical protein TanjilG_14832 [Lupinus angustifolius]|uniref:Uncharacterized protein n=2 Tax=Lupinus angustifolius TaxID=3871 RepID=A0A1J7GCX4_LUPAN|nr:hypothetical protein TanjilG_14832 [Lupinus angustifolius]